MAGTTFTTRKLRRKEVRAKELVSKQRFVIPKPQLNVVFIPAITTTSAARKAEKERLEKLRKQRRTDI